MKKGRRGTTTHDYKRNGTTSLFAALKVLEETIIGQCQSQHRDQERLKFLRLIKRSVPSDKDIHIIRDNYSTQNHPNVRSWAKRNPRFHFRFTPTGASCLSMVERFFRDLSTFF